MNAPCLLRNVDEAGQNVDIAFWIVSPRPGRRHLGRTVGHHPFIFIEPNRRPLRGASPCDRVPPIKPRCFNLSLSSRSADMPDLSFPVGRAQLMFQELSSSGQWQRLAKFNARRALVTGDVFAAMISQLGGGRPRTLT